MCNQVPCIFPRTVFFHLYHFNGKYIKIILTALELNADDTSFAKNVSLKNYFFSTCSWIVSQITIGGLGRMLNAVYKWKLNIKLEDKIFFKS